MSTEYQRYLKDRFAEEVEGESFFRGLSERTADAEHKIKWKTLAILESETREHLRVAGRAVGVELSAQSKNIQRGERLAEQFSHMPWMESLRLLQPSLKNFVAQFHAAEKIAAEGSQQRALLQRITQHEEALLAFVVCELDQRGDKSLDAILALLGKPLTNL